MSPTVPASRSRVPDGTLRALFVLFAAVPAASTLGATFLGIWTGERVTPFATASAVFFVSSLVASVWPRGWAAPLLAAEAVVLALAWMQSSNRAGDGGMLWALVAGVATGACVLGTVVMVPMALVVRGLMRKQRRTAGRSSGTSPS